MKFRHRRLVTLAAAPLILGAAVGCADESVTTIANSSEATEESGPPAPAASTATDTATTRPTAPTVTDMDAEAFHVEDDRYGFLLDDGQTTCEFEYDADDPDDAAGTCNVRPVKGPARRPVADTIVFETGATGDSGNTDDDGDGDATDAADGAGAASERTSGRTSERASGRESGAATNGRTADRGAAGIYAEATESRRTAAPDFHVLHANHRVDIGPFSCTALGSASFSCDMGEHTVTVADGVADGAEYRESRGSDRTATRTMSTLAGTAVTGETCGDVVSQEFGQVHGPLRVTAGGVDCEEVLAIIEEYINTPMDSSHGNWNVRQYRNWTCSMPTAATYEREGQHVTCGDGTGNAVAVEGDRGQNG